jgi:hypothetical protein
MTYYRSINAPRYARANVHVSKEEVRKIRIRKNIYYTEEGKNVNMKLSLCLIN